MIHAPGEAVRRFFRCASRWLVVAVAVEAAVTATATPTPTGGKSNRGARRSPVAVGGAALSRRAGPYASVGDAPRGASTVLALSLSRSSLSSSSTLARDRTRLSLTSLSRYGYLSIYPPICREVVATLETRGEHCNVLQGVRARPGTWGRASERRRRVRRGVVIVAPLSLSRARSLTLSLSLPLLFYVFYSHPAFFRSPGLEV